MESDFEATVGTQGRTKQQLNEVCKEDIYLHFANSLGAQVSSYS